MSSSKDVLKKLFKRYDKNCSQLGQRMVQSLKHEIRNCINEDQLLTKIVVDSETRNDFQLMDFEDNTKESSLSPLFDAIQQEMYSFIEFIHIWRFRTNLEDVKSLIHMLETALLPLKELELINCQIDLFVSHISKSLAHCPTLAILNLDNNLIKDEGCKDLWGGLKTTKCLKVLSLNYCSLTWKSSSYLGCLVAGTSIRALHLNGNELLSIGALEIVHECVKQVEFEMKNKKFKEKGSLRSAPIGPWITELHLSDNGLSYFIPYDIMESIKERLRKQEDLLSHYHNNTLNEYPHIGSLKISDFLMGDSPSIGIGREELDINSVTPEMIFIVLLKKTAILIAESDCLEELNLANNDIGNLGGLIMKEALERRNQSENKLAQHNKNHIPNMKLHMTHRTLHVVVTASELGGNS